MGPSFDELGNKHATPARSALPQRPSPSSWRKTDSSAGPAIFALTNEIEQICGHTSLHASDSLYWSGKSEELVRCFSRP
jgi:hypothetical protein